MSDDLNRLEKLESERKERMELALSKLWLKPIDVEAFVSVQDEALAAVDVAAAAQEHCTTLETQLAAANESARVAHRLVTERDAQLAEAQADRDAAVAAALEEAADWLESRDGYDSKDGEHPLVTGIRALIPQSGAEALERARAVRVKPLVWEGEVYEISGSALYQIWPDNGGLGAPDDPLFVFFNYMLYDMHMNSLGEFKTREEAKAAAQADYERRIRSALVHVTPDMLAQARADGMREAAGMFHEEQVQIWAQEILEGLAMADLFCPSTYDDKVDAHRIVQKELMDVAATILAAIEKGEG